MTKQTSDALCTFKRRSRSNCWKCQRSSPSPNALRITRASKPIRLDFYLSMGDKVRDKSMRCENRLRINERTRLFDIPKSRQGTCEYFLSQMNSSDRDVTQWKRTELPKFSGSDNWPTYKSTHHLCVCGELVRLFCKSRREYERVGVQELIIRLGTLINLEERPTSSPALWLPHRYDD